MIAPSGRPALGALPCAWFHDGDLLCRRNSGRMKDARHCAGESAPMDIDQIAFRIAQADLLLMALCMVLGGIVFWFPPSPRQRLSRRQLLLFRFLSVPVGLLVVWFTFTIGADPTSIR